MPYIFILQIQTVFADFNAGIGLYIPLGASISQSYQDYKLGVNNNDGKLTSGAAFEWGIGITPGIYNGFDNYMGFSIALDLAYHREVYAFNESKALPQLSNLFTIISLLVEIIVSEIVPLITPRVFPLRSLNVFKLLLFFINIACVEV